MVSWFTASDSPGLRDFWTMYEDRYDALSAASLARAQAHPQFSSLVAAISPQQRQEQGARSRELMRSAIQGDWDGYERQLRAQGAVYARSGISFSDWYEVMGGLQRDMVGALIARYGAEPDRLGAALGAMQRWMDRVMALLGEEYLRTKEELVVAERERAEREARGSRSSEERYRMLFENSPQPMWVYDQETLRFLAVNEAAVRHYGYSREEFLQLTLRDIRPDEDHAALADDVARNEPVSAARVWRHLRKDGSAIQVEISAHGFQLEGRAARLVVAHDVTERRQLEEQLRQSQKMDAVGQLAGGVAHDFNNLLTAILSFSRFIGEDLGPGHPCQPDLHEVIKAGERASALTRQLLTFSRREVVQVQPVNLNEVVSDAKRMLERLIGEHIELVTVLAPDLGDVLADRGHLEQVILNLVVNARDAMRAAGGKLTVETERVTLDDTYVRGHIGAQPGHYVLLAVTDTGVGMDDALVARIFEPFFTTKPQGEGTGLGLSTVFGIVKQSGGDIRVYSAPGRGTTFKIYLPLADQSAARAAVAARAPTRRGSETLLLVEDDASVRAVARRALTRAGYTILEAAGPEEALVLGRKEVSVQLLLTDVVMPQMNGRSLADALRKERPDLKVVFMSGYTGGALNHQGVVPSDAGYIQKPFTPEHLVERVRAALDAR